MTVFSEHHFTIWICMPPRKPCKVYDRMDHLGLTTQDVCDITGFSPAQISNLAHNRRNSTMTPSIGRFTQSALKLADCLYTSAEDLWPELHRQHSLDSRMIPAGLMFDLADEGTYDLEETLAWRADIQSLPEHLQSVDARDRVLLMAYFGFGPNDAGSFAKLGALSGLSHTGCGNIIKKSIGVLQESYGLR